MTRVTTHTEVYRRFEGELSAHAPAFWALAVMEIRTALRRKLPLLILYGPPAVATIAFSFLVYLRYSFLTQPPGEMGFRGGMAMTMADRLLHVREIVVQLNIQVRFFALLAVAWYGAGLLADDRTSGAHQLWFSRPLTRVGYLMSKFVTACFFGLLAVTAPILVLCSVAAFNSPDWVFLKEDWPLVLRSLGYSLLWVLTMSCIVLATSALSDRKSFSLAGVFGIIMITMGASFVMTEIYGDRTWMVISPTGAFQSIGEWMLDSRRGRLVDEAGAAGISIAIMTGASLAIVAWRLRKAEVVK